MKQTRTRLKALAKREKRKASFHEAAHAAVCARFGGCGVAEVWQNTAPNILAGEKAWLGQFKMFAAPGTLRMDEETRTALGALPVPENWRVLVGMAGLVAEHIADGETDAEEIAILIADTIDDGEASQTDLHFMGENWNLSDVAEVMQLLLNMWPDIELRVAALGG